jgi:hypothetical protein
MNCDLCDNTLATENDENRGICFRCHVKGIKFGFRSTGYGQSNWNESTIREVQRSYEESDAFKQGKIEKIPARKELI